MALLQKHFALPFIGTTIIEGNMHYTRIPQSFFDLLPQLSGADAKILIAVYRCTLGWNKHSAIISLSVMAKHTGITTRQITESIKRIRQLGVVTIEQTTKGYRYTIGESAGVNSAVEDTSIEDSSIVLEQSVEDISIVSEQSIEETSNEVSKKLLPYKDNKDINTTSDDVVRKPPRKSRSKQKEHPPEKPPAERTALTVFRSIHRLNVPIAVRETVSSVATDLDRWEQICTEWISRGYRPGNVSGCLAVYENGWNKNDRRPAQRQRGDVQEQVRNARMEQNIAEYLG
jgi:hypothetical protein